VHIKLPQFATLLVVRSQQKREAVTSSVAMDSDVRRRIIHSAENKKASDEATELAAATRHLPADQLPCQRRRIPEVKLTSRELENRNVSESLSARQMLKRVFSVSLQKTREGSSCSVVVRLWLGLHSTKRPASQ